MDEIKIKIKDKIIELKNWLNKPANRYSPMFPHFSNEKKWLENLLLDISDVENQQLELSIFRTETDQL